MVKIAIAGATGNVAQEIIDVLVASKKHELVLLSRKDVPVEVTSGVTWLQTDYADPQELAEQLQGVHTVLSFILVHADTENRSQRHLIDAAVQAGVTRFAPSEWATSSFKHMPWYGGKGEVREYLAALNKDRKVLEYCLFQPGFFSNYLTYPYNTSKHVAPIESPFDFQNRRALVVDGKEVSRITMTTVQDLANIVARAVEYDGEWPVNGGINGTTLTIGQLIRLGEKLRGERFAVDKLKAEDLEAGELKASWLPKAVRPASSPDLYDAKAKTLVAGVLLGIASGALDVSDEWNKLLPDYKFTQAEEFLAEVWRGKA